MSVETDRTDLLIEILGNLAFHVPYPYSEAIQRKIWLLDDLCQPEEVTDDQDLREPMA